MEEEAGTPGLPQHLSHLESVWPVRASTEGKVLCPGRAHGCLPLRCEGEWEELKTSSTATKTSLGPQ